jgi:sulfonate transport system substrate-binding protein
MNKKIIVAVSIILLIFMALVLTLKHNLFSSNQNEEIRVGWQPPWVNQGQIVAILQNTDILEKNSLKVKFIGFSFGPPMTEAALAGELDVVLAGDQPAFNLISKDRSWKIVAPLTYYYSGILVPANTLNIRALKDLKEKTIITGVGSTTYRDTIQLLRENGLEFSKDYKIKNLDVGEHLAFLEQAKMRGWQDADALATYDPTLTIAESKGLAKSIQRYRSLGVVVMNEKFYKQNPGTAKAFLQALTQAFEYYAPNQKQANEWYSKAGAYNISPDLFNKMSSVEPKLQGNKSKVNLNLTKESIEELQSHLNTAIKLGLIQTNITIQDMIKIA